MKKESSKQLLKRFAEEVHDIKLDAREPFWKMLSFYSAQLVDKYKTRIHELESGIVLVQNKFDELVKKFDDLMKDSEVVPQDTGFSTDH